MIISQLSYSQQDDFQMLQQQERQLEDQLEAMKIFKMTFIQQSDSLAALIQELKTKPDLNIFQRRRLEQLLKSSQQIDQNIAEINRKIESLVEEHQNVLKELVSWYDQQIGRVLNVEKEIKMTPEQKQAQIRQLTQWNTKRNEYLKKIEPNDVNIQLTKPIRIETSDSYQTMKQKADLVKDQEDKIRKQLKLADKRVEDLQKELKLRNRMNELIADTYLLDQPTEKFLPQGQPKGANENVFNIDSGERAPGTSALFEVVDNLLLKTDLSGISNLDLETYIRNLQQVKLKLGRSADSLATVADQFYKAAEKKRKDSGRE